MGIFNKTAYINDDEPVYKNQNNQYLYYWAAYKDWRIGSDYTTSSAGVQAVGDNGPICPVRIDRWKYYIGDSEWIQGTLTNECSSNLHLFHAFISFPRYRILLSKGHPPPSK